MTATRKQHSTKQTEARAILYLAFELGWSEWKLAFATGPADNPRLRSIAGRNTEALLAEIAKAKKRFGLAEDVPVHSCYEAGRDGFWLHRFLESERIVNLVVDSSSIEVKRRGRRRKTDRLDAGKLLSMLIRWQHGEKDVWSIVQVPSAADEDRRQLHRELLELLDRQIKDLENERGRRIRSSHDKVVGKVRQLLRLRGIGANSAWLYVMEFFGWRRIRNRKQLASRAGLTPTPYQSGDSDHEQGISKAGNRRLRTMAVEIAWCWLHYQPGSGLSEWYQKRFAKGSSRQRRIGIVALARKLLVALWRFLESGEVPAGAEIVTWKKGLLTAPEEATPAENRAG
jgi:transposase